MSLRTKQIVIALLSGLFLVSLILVQWMEVARKSAEVGVRLRHTSIPQSSRACVDCHKENSPGIVGHWEGSTHASKGVGCVDCHQAQKEDADAFEHYGALIATIVTPRDCAQCHQKEAEQFAHSHHAAGGNILASLDNFLAETVEGSRVPFNPHGETPGMEIEMVNGMASSFTGCQQCHGSKVALLGPDDTMITYTDLQPDENGHPTNLAVLATIQRAPDGERPLFHPSTWPNTGIGRLNLDGSLGSCSACHSRHDFSPRRARQPENCGKCHLGPDHPQEEIYEESKHGVAYRDLRDQMNLDAETWVLGEDYSAAPTCATCHMSANVSSPEVTHDPGERISWTNRPPISLLMDTDAAHKVVTETDPELRRELITDTWQDKRQRMRNVCSQCHTPDYVSAFYRQYDDFVVLYNEKFARPGQQIMATLTAQNLITPAQFDEEIEWTWFYLWHHEGRRARHGASMMAPDYAHWHGMYEVAERFYMELIPQAQEIADHAEAEGMTEQAASLRAVIDEILARPEHEWFLSQQAGASSRYSPAAAQGQSEESAEHSDTAELTDDESPAEDSSLDDFPPEEE